MATIIAAAAVPVSSSSPQPCRRRRHHRCCRGCGHGEVAHTAAGFMATRWVQVRGHGEARNCEAQGDMGAHQRRHVLSSPRIIAVNALLQSVVGPWWALKGEGR